MALSLYILLGLLIIVLELRRRFSGQPFDAMTAFNCYYFVLFVFVPINVMCFGEDVVRQKYAYETYGSGETSTALAIFFSYLFFCFGYWVISPKEPKPGVPAAKNCFSLHDSTHIAIIVFFAGVLLTLVYVLQMGGISAVISEASAVRFGEYRVESEFIFYRFFSQFSADAFVLFCVVLLGKKVRNIRITWVDKVFLLCACVFFVFYGLSTAGRREFIYPILLCYLVHWSLGGHVKKMAAAALVLIFMIAGLGALLGPVVLSGNLSTVFDALDISQADWLTLFAISYGNATSGLADSYIHFVGAQHASLWQFGFLTDIVNLPRDFFPSRLLGFERTLHMYGQTTEFFTGLPLPAEDVDMSGLEPLGLHGYLLVNFSYVGMFAAFFVLGLIYEWLHSRLKPSDPKDAVGWLIYWWVALGFFVYFRDGVLILVLKQQLTWWLVTAALLYYRARRRAAMPGLSGRTVLVNMSLLLAVLKQTHKRWPWKRKTEERV
jgi:oligosaccharide repeat unit polymerase